MESLENITVKSNNIHIYRIKSVIRYHKEDQMWLQVNEIKQATWMQLFYDSRAGESTEQVSGKREDFRNKK